MLNNPLFDRSYDRLFGGDVTMDDRSDGFFQAFYRHFLKDPDIHELFRETDMQRQVLMLRRSFFQLAAFYVTTTPSAELERIGYIHQRLGVTNDHFDRWLDALVATVAEIDPECDACTELAWRWAMTPGITFLKLFSYYHAGRKV